MLAALGSLLGLVTKDKAISLGKDLYHRLAKSPEERKHLADLDAKLETEEGQRELQATLGQLKVNKEEAKHTSIWVAGWRPFIGWGIGANVISLGFVLTWKILMEQTIPDLQPMWPFFTLLATMLGANLGLRSRDKRLGTAK